MGKSLWSPEIVGCVLALVIGLTSLSAIAADAPLVIAHRGASGYLPEHTLEAYSLAHGFGADYIEPDLVFTQDGVFICLHDIHLEDTTDVEEVFPDRARDDGRWYAADFTLAEVRTLGVHERLNGRFPKGASRFEVPTFDEMVELIQGLNGTTGQSVGIYPELKAPAWHRKNGLPMEKAFLAAMTKHGYAGPKAKVFVQCFEAEALRRMRLELGSELPQIMLLGGQLTHARLKTYAEFANGIGPSKSLIESNPEVVGWAHALGLQVHPYTMRADAVPSKYESHEAELIQFIQDYNVDGFFTDFPDRARKLIDGRKP